MSRVLVRFLVAVCLLALPGEVFGQSHTLSGTVFGGGSPLPNTLVEALSNGTTTVAGSSTTNGSGQYSITLPDATYDLRVTPPAGSGFGQEVIQDVVVAAGIPPRDIILLASASSVTGTVRGYGGQPVANARVSFYTNSTGTFLGAAATDTAGHYSFNASGTVRVELMRDFVGTASPYVPVSWNYSRYGIVIAGAMTLDFDLPVVQVSGTVTGSNGPPLAGVIVQGSNYRYDSQSNSNSNASNTTNASGQYSMLLLTGTTSLTAQPPNGSGFSAESHPNLNVTADTGHDFVLQPASAVTGTVRGYGGQPVANARVSFYTNSTGTFLGAANTDAAGHYSFNASGTVRVELMRNFVGTTSPYVPVSWNYSRYGIVISGAMTLDFDLPVVQVSGTVTGANGTPLASVIVQGSNYRYDSQSNSNSNGSNTTNASGQYSMLLLTGTTSLTAQPPNGSDFSAESHPNLNVAADTVHDFVLQPASAVTGTVRGYGGQPVANARVSFYTNSTGTFLGAASTDAAGHYSFNASGTVRVELMRDFVGTASPYVPVSWNYSRYDIVISGAMTLDFDLPVVKVSGAATDSNGAPVPNVVIQGNNYRYDPQSNSNSNGSNATNLNGQYSFLLFIGTTSITIQPPAASGFTSVSLSGLSLTQDLTQTIVLQRPDLSPPQIVAGPVVVHLSDTSVSISWTTNEAASSTVDYGTLGLTSNVTDTTLSTNHAVTLVGLDPVTTYLFRVGSKDKGGNGPTVSSQGTFTTQAAPGDITPPVITAGPTVASVNQTTAIIEWTTDEPASTRVEFGTDNMLGMVVNGPLGRFEQPHTVTLNGLAPETTYFARVTSADPDDNSTSSSLFSFTTLAVPDTTPPVITSGPSVLSKTDTKITIVWETNEPATSGVSYNDGVRFDVIADTTLTRTHQITLSGLSPQTTYSIRVSSTDAAGNGPTLSAPANATTNATPDTTAPVIANLQVTSITTSSATVSWTTNEAANSQVTYGRTSGGLDNSVANVSSVFTHSMTLTGLSDGATYYLSVSSTDAAGNTANSAESSFRTESAFVDMPPTAPGPITAPLAPTNAATYTVSWGASVDDIGITGYDLLRNGDTVASVSGATTMVDESGLGEGSYAYQVRATDTAGHTALSGTVTVVIDRTPPMIEVPASFSVNAVGTGASVEYAVSTTDSVDPHVLAVCQPLSGSTLPVGTTVVQCTAGDRAGNVGDASFSVIVRDVTPPALTLPSPMVVEASSASGAVVTFAATAVDLIDGPVDVTCVPATGETFPIGTTTVECTAADAAQNTATGQFVVTVLDTTAPVLASIIPSQASLSPPNHQLIRVSFAAVASDAVGASCSIISATSSEADNGTGDGDTANDVQIAGALQADLRAERDPKNGGRIYTISVRCTDPAGNVSATKSATVIVPKSQGK